MSSLHFRPWLIYDGLTSSYAILLVERDVIDPAQVKELAIGRLYCLGGRERVGGDMEVKMLSEMPGRASEHGAHDYANPDMFTLEFRVSEPYVSFDGLE